MKRNAADYSLHVGNAEVGRLHERTARFCGFESEATARAAGTAACDVLGTWYRERARLGHRGTVMPLPVEEVAPEDRLLLDGTVVGRIVTAPSDGERPDTYDMEVALPGNVLHALAAHLVARIHAEVAHRPARQARAGGSLGAPVPTSPAAENRSSDDY